MPRVNPGPAPEERAELGTRPKIRYGCKLVCVSRLCCSIELYAAEDSPATVPMDRKETSMGTHDKPTPKPDPNSDGQSPNSQ
jgi:hypothetical protein